MLLNILYALFGSLGFGIIFNLRGKNLFIACLGGGLAWSAYEISTSLGLSSTTSLFIGTLVLSIYSEIMARVMKQPVTVFIIASMIPLVPGSGMYYTTFEIVKGNFSNSLSLGIQTLMDAGAIAVGVVLISSIARIMKQLKYNKIKV